MKFIFALFSIIGAQVIWFTDVSAQKEPAMNLAEAIWKHTAPPPSIDELPSIEAKLVRITIESRDVDCFELQNEFASFASLLGSGSASRLYPDIFNLGFTLCPDWDPFGYLLIGDVFFRNQDFERAATLYELAAKGLKFDDEAHLTATLNSGACMISSGKYTEAISAFQRVIDHPYERADVYRPMATINLSAAQLNAGFYSDAVRTIRQLPTENLSDYWRGIHFSNALIAHQRLADYSGSDSVWQNHLSAVPFESLPLEIHPQVLSELLHRGDFIEFTKFKKSVIEAQQSPLLDPSHNHHLLFEEDEFNDESNLLWDLYRKFEEAQREANRALRDELEPQLQSDFQLIQQELGRERLSKRNWILASSVILVGLLILFLVIFILRTRRLRKHLSSHPSANYASAFHGPQVDEDDLVVLAQALTYGKGLQKALLIIRRLRAEFAENTHSRLNLQGIELYNELNEREKEVVGYIAAGFNSKEIAQLVNVSTQYIYNVRCRIREKFGVPDDRELLQWLREAGQLEQFQDEYQGRLPE